MTDNQITRTFVMLKPDCIQRGLVGQIVQRFEVRGLKLVAMKFMFAKREKVEELYLEHFKRPFYQSAIEHILSGPVIPMVWEGTNAFMAARQLIGASAMEQAIAGTIRYDFCIDRQRNLIHGAHSAEEADREIKIWFDEKDFLPYELTNSKWVIS